MCEYCERDYFYEIKPIIASTDIHAFLDSNLLQVDINGEHDRLEFSKVINYCPMCGRTLNENPELLEEVK